MSSAPVQNASITPAPAKRNCARVCAHLAISTEAARTSNRCPPDDEPEEIRSDGGSPYEPFEALQGREDEDQVDIVTAGDALEDALQPGPSLVWPPEDQPPHERHTQHDADDQEQAGRSHVELRVDAVDVDDDGNERRQVNEIVGHLVETGPCFRREKLEPGHFSVAAVQEAATPQEDC